MTASAVLLPLQTPAATGSDVHDLERALGAGWQRLRFDAPLEDAYERATGAGRMRRYIVCNVISLVAFWMLSADAPGLTTDILGVLSPLRWSVAIALFCLLVVFSLLPRSLQAWQRETITAAGALTAAGYAIISAHYMGNVAAVMRSGGILLVLLHASIGARLQFRSALAVNLLTCFGYAWAAHGDSIDATQVVQNQMLLFASVMLFGLIGNYALEYRERRGYLLQCLKVKHHDALLADAEILRQLAMRDGLTNLYNRRHFDTELARAWQSGLHAGRAVGVLQVDVDHFKAYNDRCGHPAGDRCLVLVATALQAAAARAGGIAARVGGEEFALLLTGLDDAALDRVAADVCDSVRALALRHEGSLCASQVTVSIGAASVRPAPGLQASTLVGTADAALYAAKRQGRDRWTRFDAHLHVPAPSGADTVQTAGDSLAPEPQESSAGSSKDSVLIERYSGLLASGFRWLRFPADLETEFQEQGADARRKLLAGLVAAGLTMTLVYVWLCGPVLGDIADLLLGRMWLFSGLAMMAVLASVRMQFGWRVREGVVSAIVSVFGLCIVWTEASGRGATVFTATLGLCLLPMFSSLLAGQPFRYSLAPSLLICIGVATMMIPERPELQPTWLNTLGVIVDAALYSLLGGYLLELSTRRAYLLDRLRVAQLAVLRRNTEHLQRLATLDPLTRLPNRRHFEAELDRLSAVCLATQRPLALLILDIDYFKHYNDGYGHPAGDACLQRVGGAIGRWASGDDAQPAGAAPAVPARLGGEEFGVLLPDADGSTALAAAQRLRIVLRDLRIEHAHSPGGRFVTVSIGAASLVLGSTADARRLLQAADTALYRAKGLGRDQVAA